jgi:hypothetical protein
MTSARDSRVFQLHLKQRFNARDLSSCIISNHARDRLSLIFTVFLHCVRNLMHALTIH